MADGNQVRWGGGGGWIAVGIQGEDTQGELERWHGLPLLQPHGESPSRVLSCYHPEGLMFCHQSTTTLYISHKAKDTVHGKKQPMDYSVLGSAVEVADTLTHWLEM